jgi:hypothetical protein
MALMLCATSLVYILHNLNPILPGLQVTVGPLNALVQLGAPWITPTTIHTTGAPIWPHDLFGDEEEERAAVAAAQSALALPGAAGAQQVRDAHAAPSSASFIRDPTAAMVGNALVHCCRQKHADYNPASA